MDLTDGKWKESDRVLQLLQGRFLVLNRMQQPQNIGDNNNNNNNNDATTNHNHNDNHDDDDLQQQQQRLLLQERVASVPGARLVSIPTLGDVSSSQVRQAVAAQDWGFLQQKGILHPKVLDYIRDKGLYVPSLSSSS